MKVQNKGWDSGEVFRVGDEMHTVVGYYTGSGGYAEMFTKIPSENGLTIYVCWDNHFEMYWSFRERSTLTELDLVCRLFHRGDRGRNS
jgi:hypothetical protein